MVWRGKQIPQCAKSGTATRTPPGNADLHERVGWGTYGGLVMVLISGLDLSTGKIDTLVGGEGGLGLSSARIQARELPPF